MPERGTSIEDTGSLTLGAAGAEFNVCATVARLGLRSALVSRLGADPLGRRVRRILREQGVDDALMADEPGAPTGFFLREALADGQRRAYYYRHGSAASTMDITDAERGLAARPSAIVVSGLTAALGTGPRECVRAAAAGAAAAGALLVVDPNLRPALGDLDLVASLVRSLLDRTDLLVLGLDEAPAILGTDDPGEALTAARAAGCGQAVVKGGADGAWVLDGDRVVHVPARAREVVDPVGAGDAFLGGFLAATLRGEDSVAAAELASTEAGRIVETSGDLPTPCR